MFNFESFGQRLHLLTIHLKCYSWLTAADLTQINLQVKKASPQTQNPPKRVCLKWVCLRVADAIRLLSAFCFLRRAANPIKPKPASSMA